MKKIDTLASIEGRNLIFDIFHELKYEKQLSSISTLFQCWKICTSEREIHRYVNKDYQVIHPLGFFSGTALWMEEIVNRYYFSVINSFVYFGAAVLLVLIGIRRFSDSVSDSLVIAGVAFEALMLLFLFIVMFFSPNEMSNVSQQNEKSSENNDNIEELILEIGEISRDFAAVIVQLDKMNQNLEIMYDQQKKLTDSIKNIAESTALAVAPNPELINSMKDTSETLKDFKSNIEQLNSVVQRIESKEIEFAVKKEIEKIIHNKIAEKVQ